VANLFCTIDDRDVKAKFVLAFPLIALSFNMEMGLLHINKRLRNNTTPVEQKASLIFLNRCRPGYAYRSDE
jgi:hypothetical protein